MRLRITAGIAFVVFILGACLLTQFIALTASADMDAPTISIGDYWEYNTEFVLEGARYKGSLRYKMLGSENHTIGNMTHSVYVLSLSGEGTFSHYEQGVSLSGGWIAVGLDYFDESNNEQVKSVRSMDLDGSWRYSGMSGGFSESRHNTSTYELISSTWDYPLRVGDAGEVRRNVVSSSSYKTDLLGLTSYNSSVDSEYNEIVGYSCPRTEEVTAAVGIYNAYLVKMVKGDGSHTDIWFSPEVGASVKYMYYDENGTWLGSDQLISFKYQNAQKGKSNGQLMNIMAAGITIALVLMALLAGLLAMRKPGPTAKQELALSESAIERDEPVTEAGITTHKGVQRKKITFEQLAVRYGCVTMIVVGLLLFAFGLYLIGVINTQYEIIDYETDYEWNGTFLTDIQHKPVFGRTSSHPYQLPGLFLFALGASLCMGGFAPLIRNEGRIMIGSGMKVRDMNGPNEAKDERNNEGRRHSRDSRKKTNNAKYSLVLGCVGAAIVGIVLLVGAMIFWNVEMSNEFLENRSDFFDEEDEHVGRIIDYPLRDESVVLSVAGSVLIGLGVVGIVVYVAQNGRRRRVLIPVKSKP